MWLIFSWYYMDWTIEWVRWSSNVTDARCLTEHKRTKKEKNKKTHEVFELSKNRYYLYRTINASFFPFFYTSSSSFSCLVLSLYTPQPIPVTMYIVLVDIVISIIQVQIYINDDDVPNSLRNNLTVCTLSLSRLPALLYE